jgi:hypothetical protein
MARLPPGPDPVHGGISLGVALGAWLAKCGHVTAAASSSRAWSSSRDSTAQAGTQQARNHTPATETVAQAKRHAGQETGSPKAETVA